ncbi:unnamed protein product [Arctia plantaginis]|uniref:Uncharacterized protein n=1 Tax=Arctia plantaginis TaxID=874455 RepID=A0A8S0YZT1_ARCPL|nr:unnamed protein product [Arctia plantaginis]
MYQSGVMVAALFIFTKINAESSEDSQTFTYYAPPTLNFQDIYANNLALLTEDSTMSNLLDDEPFHIKNVPAEFVEFNPQSVTAPSLTSLSSKHSLNSTSSKNNTAAITTPLRTTSTTEEPESTVKVLPIVKSNKYQRGVLDLLFPATRVKNFKSVFDTVRRLLSHTF